jgi:hypothetical protein
MTTTAVAAQTPTAEWLADRAERGRYRISYHVMQDRWAVVDIDDPEEPDVWTGRKHGVYQQASAKANELNAREQAVR